MNTNSQDSTKRPVYVGGETLCNTCGRQYFDNGFNCNLISPVPHLKETGNGRSIPGTRGHGLLKLIFLLRFQKLTLSEP